MGVTTTEREAQSRGLCLQLLFHPPTTRCQHSAKPWDEELRIQETAALRRLEPEMIPTFHLIHSFILRT